MMREADFARTRLRTAADERDVRDRVMRRAERSLAQAARCRLAACPRPNGSRCTRARPRRRAAAGSLEAAARAWSCPRRADRSSEGCARPRPRPRAPAARTAGRAGHASRRCGRERRGRRRAAAAVSAATPMPVGSAPRPPRAAMRRAEAGVPRRPPLRSRSARAAAGQSAPLPARRGRDRQHPARCVNRAVERELADEDDRDRDRWPRTTPSAARMPSAIGRSNDDPAFRTSAGARLIVMRCDGKSKPELRIAARTRSRLSRTLASGRPTIRKKGSPRPTSTST